VTDEDWARLIDAIRSIGLEVQRMDRRNGTLLVRIPPLRQ